MKSIALTGLTAAPFTPFHADGGLNLGLVQRYVQHLADEGVNGAFVGGTTGEWASLTQEERRALAAAWRQEAGSKLKIVVHVGHNNLRDSIDLARHAESIEADAIGAIMPSFFRPATLAEVVDYCRQIAGAAPRTPFYYYHFPEMTGVNFSMEKLLEAAREVIPTFRGIKFTYWNLWDFGLAVVAAGDRHEVLWGRDEVLLGGLGAGAKGAVGSTYNYSARLYHGLMRSHAAGRVDEAREQMVYVQKTLQAQQVAGGGIPAGKALMALIGLDCGPCRPPLARMTAEQTAALRSALDRHEYFTRIKV